MTAKQPLPPHPCHPGTRKQKSGCFCPSVLFVGQLCARLRGHSCCVICGVSVDSDVGRSLKTTDRKHSWLPGWVPEKGVLTQLETVLGEGGPQEQSYIWGTVSGSNHSTECLSACSPGGERRGRGRACRERGIKWLTYECNAQTREGRRPVRGCPPSLG